MTKRAFDKIAGGLNEALQVASAVPRLNSVQRQALLWMPASGGSISRRPLTGAPAWMTMAVLCRLGLVSKYTDWRGEWFHLTDAGIAARDGLEKRGDAS